MFKATLPLLLVVISAGCVVTSAPIGPAPIEVQGFDDAEVSYIHYMGTNRIEGNAFLRQRGGGVVTCAGEAVRLVPLGRFAKRYFRIKYIEQKAATLDVRDAPAFQKHMRTTRCESDGRFLFTGVAAGDYFIETTVSWFAGFQQGGDVGYALEVRGVGNTARVVMSGEDVVAVTTPSAWTVGPDWGALLAE